MVEYYLSVFDSSRVLAKFTLLCQRVLSAYSRRSDQGDMVSEEQVSGVDRR